MSDPASATRVLERFESLEDLRTAWEGDLASRRRLVPDIPTVELLEPVILDLALGDEVVVSLWAHAVFRIPGDAGGLGLELAEIPEVTHERMEEVLAAARDDERESEDPAGRDSGGDDNRPWVIRYRGLSGPEKMQIALRGDRDARVQVVKEANPQLLKYLLQNPKVTTQEIASIAGNTGTPMDVLKLISEHPVHSQAESIRLALVKNPRTPIPIVRKHMDKLPRRHIAQIAKSDHVRAEVGRIAKKIVVTRRT